MAITVFSLLWLALTWKRARSGTDPDVAITVFSLLWLALTWKRARSGTDPDR
ncbi:hypothetical protein ACXIZN_04810 [Amycolatopsis sp. TRM77291]